MSEALAWCAGLFDGEGSVYLRGQGADRRAGAMLYLVTKHAAVQLAIRSCTSLPITRRRYA